MVCLHPDSFKISPKPNSDGLIKCLPPARTVFQSIPKSMREKLKPSISFGTTGQFYLPGQYLWLAGRRAGALFFTWHQDNFVVIRNFTAVYQDLVPFRSFTVTLGFSALYRDWQKTSHRDADGT